MITEQRAVSDHAIIELLETKAFFSLPKIYRDIIRSADINDKERYFIYELFFDFLEHWRKGSNNNRLTVTVQKLSYKYGRSLETIRRYLRSLEEAGLIRKILTTIKKAGQILTPITGIEFILPDAVAREALSQENRSSVNNTTKNLSENNKTDHCTQQKKALQDNKNVELLLDQDQIEELLDMIILLTNKNNYKLSIPKQNLFYILKRFKTLPFHMGYKTIKNTITQMLFDINKDGWRTNDLQFRLNIMLKMIQNNTYKVYIDSTIKNAKKQENKPQPGKKIDNQPIKNINNQLLENKPANKKIKPSNKSEKKNKETIGKLLAGLKQQLYGQIQ